MFLLLSKKVSPRLLFSRALLYLSLCDDGCPSGCPCVAGPPLPSMSCGWSNSRHNATKHSSFGISGCFMHIVSLQALHPPSCGWKLHGFGRKELPGPHLGLSATGVRDAERRRKIHFIPSSGYREGGLGARAAPCPKICSKSCSFQAILKRKPPILSKFLAQGSPLGSKLRWAPLTKILDPHLIPTLFCCSFAGV